MLQSCERAIQLNPKHAGAQSLKAQTLILLGRYAEGWPLHEWRWLGRQRNAIRSFSQPQWKGDEPLAGRTLLIVPEMGLGDNCNNCLIFGPDNRIWGLTVKCVFAAERDLSRFEKVADYEDHAGLNCNRFGLCTGPDGNVYFPNGLHLMRIRAVR